MIFKDNDYESVSKYENKLRFRDGVFSNKSFIKDFIKMLNYKPGGAYVTDDHSNLMMIKQI